MNRKAKGTKGERELVKAFHDHGWSCARIAGSGSMQYPSPDLIAGNAIRRVAIECKVTKDQKRYIPQEEIDQLHTFSCKFGAESWIGIRFPGEQWYFLLPEDLEKTGKHGVVSLELARRRGLTVQELLQSESETFKSVVTPSKIDSEEN